MRFSVRASSETSSPLAGSGSRRAESPLRSISAAAQESLPSGPRLRRVSAAAAAPPMTAASRPQSASSRRRRRRVSSMSDVLEATSTAPPATGPASVGSGAA